MNWFDKQLHRFADWLNREFQPQPDYYTEPNTCYVYAVEKCCCGEKRILLGDLNTIGYHSERRIALMNNGWADGDEVCGGRKLCTTCLTDRTIRRVYEDDE
jgi:hypothetical protein